VKLSFFCKLCDDMFLLASFSLLTLGLLCGFWVLKLPILRINILYNLRLFFHCVSLFYWWSPMTHIFWWFCPVLSPVLVYLGWVCHLLYSAGSRADAVYVPWQFSLLCLNALNHQGRNSCQRDHGEWQSGVGKPGNHRERWSRPAIPATQLISSTEQQMAVTPMTTNTTTKRRPSLVQSTRLWANKTIAIFQSSPKLWSSSLYRNRHLTETFDKSFLVYCCQVCQFMFPCGL
jgi:hypothetical protein